MSCEHFDSRRSFRAGLEAITSGRRSHLTRAMRLGAVLMALTGGSAYAEYPYSVQWYRSYLMGGVRTADGMTMDSSGNIYLTGIATTPNGENVYLSIFDNDGEPLFFKAFSSSEGSAPVYSEDITADEFGNVYFTGSVDYDLGTGNPLDKHYTFVQKFANGTTLWTRYLNPEDFLSSYDNLGGHSVAVDNNGNVYVGGDYPLTRLWGGFLAKYNSAGGILWAFSIEKSLDDWVRFDDVAVDNIGDGDNIDDVYAAGYLYPAGRGYPEEGWVMKVNPENGQEIWRKAYNTSYGFEISLAASDGKVYITGGSHDDDHVGYSFLEVRDAVTGDQIGETWYSGTHDDYGPAQIAIDPSGNVFVLTYYTLYKFDPMGNPLWTRDYPSPEYTFGIEFDDAGNPYLAGPPGWYPGIAKLNSHPGDFDGDGDVDANDIDLLYANFDYPSIIYDLDGDGAASQVDMDDLIDVILDTYYGDANLDGAVDGADFNAWLERAGTGWAHGDWNGNGTIDGGDFNLWQGRPARIAGGYSTAIPEPTSAMALMTLLTLLATRRGHRARRTGLS